VIGGIRVQATKGKVRGLWVPLVLAMLCASAPAWSQEIDAEEIRSETEKALERGDIQRDAPLAEHADDIAEDPSLQHEPPKHRAPPPPASSSGVPIPGEIFLSLLIAVLAIALCIVAYHLYGTYAPGRRMSKKKVDQPLQVATQPIARSADAPLPDLDEIERLARAGAYAEAIHLMLLRALEALRRRLGTSWAKSMTSREIARRSELPATDRTALKMLVGAVEISRFGGQSANEQIYRACLDQYRLIGEPRMANA
jgi:hypothetical protein